MQILTNTFTPREANAFSSPAMKSPTLARLRDSFYECRERLSFKFHFSNKLRIRKWIVPTPYHFIYDAAPDLLKRGTLVWAYLIQANRNLFADGPDDHPAHLVFGIDNESNDLALLKGYVEYLIELKKMSCQPSSLRDFTHLLMSEDNPVFNKKLPSSITSQYKVCFTSTIIHRQYLPYRQLYAPWLPLLVNPAVTDASIVLPSRYWTREVNDLWKSHSLLTYDFK